MWQSSGHTSKPANPQEILRAYQEGGSTDLSSVVQASRDNYITYVIQCHVETARSQYDGKKMLTMLLYTTRLSSLIAV